MTEDERQRLEDEEQLRAIAGREGHCLLVLVALFVASAALLTGTGFALAQVML